MKNPDKEKSFYDECTNSNVSLCDILEAIKRLANIKTGEDTLRNLLGND